jgi:hypothetical protein
MGEYLQKASDYGRDAAGKGGAVGLGAISTLPVLIGGGLAAYGASKLDGDSIREAGGAAKTSFEQVSSILEGEAEMDDLDKPEISDESAYKLSSAAKYGGIGLGALALGALGYKKSGSLW